MFVLYAVLITILFVLLDLLYVKTYQLENYKIKKYIKKISRVQFAVGDKSILNYTKRVFRLIFCDFFIKMIVFTLFLAFLPCWWQSLIAVAVLFLLSPLFVILSFLTVYPIELIIKEKFLRKAKKKLKKMNCKTIAITGSFGKTSTKNILYEILKEEFDVCATPKSFNTPMGICKTILQDLKETDEFFVVEFGARKKGDIDFLAKFVGVDFGIITPIGNCHLETFGNLQTIENTKYELCENAKSLVVFNGKSFSTKKLYQQYHSKKYLVCETGSFAYAKDIVTTKDGSKFVMVLDENQFECTTKLLGKSNIDNIVVASSMAYLLGESLFAIQRAITKTKPTAHRLELICGNFVTVIDDSYNSNAEGFAQALEILQSFDARKIVVSPGMVELGKEQEQNNFKVGKLVGEQADLFVVMNETNKKALIKGAIEGGMPKDKIFFANSRQKQKEILKKVLKQGDVVLFENDFPDNLR